MSDLLNDLRVDIINLHPNERVSIFREKQAVKVTHLPTGIKAQCGHYKSNHKNRKVCIEMIEFALQGK